MPLTKVKKYFKLMLVKNKELFPRIQTADIIEYVIDKIDTLRNIVSNILGIWV